MQTRPEHPLVKGVSGIFGFCEPDGTIGDWRTRLDGTEGLPIVDKKTATEDVHEAVSLCLHCGAFAPKLTETGGQTELGNLNAVMTAVDKFLRYVHSLEEQGILTLGREAEKQPQKKKLPRKVAPPEVKRPPKVTKYEAELWKGLREVTRHEYDVGVALRFYERMFPQQVDDLIAKRMMRHIEVFNGAIGWGLRHEPVSRDVFNTTLRPKFNEFLHKLAPDRTDGQYHKVQVGFYLDCKRTSYEKTLADNPLLEASLSKGICRVCEATGEKAYGAAADVKNFVEYTLNRPAIAEQIFLLKQIYTEKGWIEAGDPVSVRFDAWIDAVQSQKVRSGGGKEKHHTVTNVRPNFAHKYAAFCGLGYALAEGNDDDLTGCSEITRPSLEALIKYFAEQPEIEIQVPANPRAGRPGPTKITVKLTSVTVVADLKCLNALLGKRYSWYTALSPEAFYSYMIIDGAVHIPFSPRQAAPPAGKHLPGKNNPYGVVREPLIPLLEALQTIWERWHAELTSLKALLLRVFGLVLEEYGCKTLVTGWLREKQSINMHFVNGRFAAPGAPQKVNCQFDDCEAFLRFTAVNGLQADVYGPVPEDIRGVFEQAFMDYDWCVHTLRLTDVACADQMRGFSLLACERHALITVICRNVESDRLAFDPPSSVISKAMAGALWDAANADIPFPPGWLGNHYTGEQEMRRVRRHAGMLGRYGFGRQGRMSRDAGIAEGHANMNNTLLMLHDAQGEPALRKVQAGAWRLEGDITRAVSDLVEGRIFSRWAQSVPLPPTVTGKEQLAFTYWKQFLRSVEPCKRRAVSQKKNEGVKRDNVWEIGGIAFAGGGQGENVALLNNCDHKHSVWVKVANALKNGQIEENILTVRVEGKNKTKRCPNIPNQFFELDVNKAKAWCVTAICHEAARGVKVHTVAVPLQTGWPTGINVEFLFKIREKTHKLAVRVTKFRADNAWLSTNAKPGSQLIVEVHETTVRKTAGSRKKGGSRKMLRSSLFECFVVGLQPPHDHHDDEPDEDEGDGDGDGDDKADEGDGDGDGDGAELTDGSARTSKATCIKANAQVLWLRFPEGAVDRKVHRGELPDNFGTEETGWETSGALAKTCSDVTVVGIQVTSEIHTLTKALCAASRGFAERESKGPDGWGCRGAMAAGPIGGHAIRRAAAVGLGMTAASDRWRGSQD